MKVNNHHQGIIAAVTWECRSNTVRIWLVFLLLLSAVCAMAQENFGPAQIQLRRGSAI